jgi:uncharacterized protein (DUF1800 family)
MSCPLSSTPETGLSPTAVASIAGTAGLVACGGGGSSGAGNSAPNNTLTPSQASRFLSQAAIGHGKSDINSLTTSGIDGWLSTQFAVPRSQRFWDFLKTNGYDAPTNINTTAGFDPMVWSQLIGSPDMLRQRVGLALLNQWVVSIDGLTSNWRSFVMAAYLDVLWDQAFGNYRDIMEGVATSAGMGQYLTYLGSVKENPATGSIPDENFARELMQLFTIGLYQLNNDGSLVLSNGSPVVTYTQADVSAHARVWTGYVYASSDNTTPDRMRLALSVNASLHESGQTNFVGISIPAGTDGVAARKLVLDGLFAHPNVPPFVSKQLIQHMVTSNPSPAYIQRVAQAFINNGNGVRGDMKALIRAILTDPEARDDGALNSTTFGKLREPVVRLTQWARAFNVSSPSNGWPFGNTSSSANSLGQGVGHAPSVFNWFRPGYSIPGTNLANAGLVAPEFQITNEPSVVAYVNCMQSLIVNGAGDAKPDYSSLKLLATNSQALLDEINLVLAANQIQTSTLIRMRAALDTIDASTPAGINNRIVAALVLVMASPEYLVLR